MESVSYCYNRIVKLGCVQGAHRVLVWERLQTQSLVLLRRRCENNTKMDLTEVDCEYGRWMECPKTGFGASGVETSGCAIRVLISLIS
jgi:hypothetical protein